MGVPERLSHGLGNYICKYSMYVLLCLQETSEAQGIQAMPTFIFYKNGKKVESLRGANEVKLRELIEKFA
jgi:pyrrolidone-carboxylate peptidase